MCAGVALLLSVAVLIPALHPSEGFPTFVAELAESGMNVVVIDDGSGPEFAHIFGLVASIAGATVLTHSHNRGKGRALKTGFQYCLDRTDIDGIVTADSDGQHTRNDIVAVAAALSNAPISRSASVLGVREFDLPSVPRKSAAGNKLTSRVVQILFGRRFKDTQTGLRGFGRSLIPLMLSVRGDRFEYEMNSLLRLVHDQVTILEVPIATVYHDIENSQSHFRPVRDSLRIYAVIFKQFFFFTASSLIGSAADILLFTLLINLLFEGDSAASGVFAATLGARIGSAVLNFVLNRRAVFSDDSSRRRGVLRYATLAVGLVICSTIGVSVLAPLTGGHVVYAKAAIDTVLFVASFLIQKRWVFAAKSPRKSTRASATMVR